MSDSNDEAPAWLVKRIDQLLGQFDMPAWRYNVKVLDQEALDKQAGVPETSAYTHVNDCYLSADFYFCQGIADDDHNREHMVHEVLHCLFGPLNQAGFYFRQFVPKGKSWEMMEAMWIDAMEEVVTRLARIITPLIDWGQHGPAEQSDQGARDPLDA